MQNPRAQIKANPPDINILPNYGKDPRTVDKLLDGTYLTCDDLHVWLAPFTRGQFNYIYIYMPQVTTISMIRVWNFNKSRIHTPRGVRQLQIKLDEQLIFSGEIRQAPGNLKNIDACCEYVMFTSSESILQQIEVNDWLNQGELEEIRPVQDNQLTKRPPTATK